MKVNAVMKYLGKEHGTSKDGKKYVRIGLLQGFQSEMIYINNDELEKKIEKLKPMTDVECTLNIFIGERTFVSLLDITSIPFEEGKK